eukprot:CAMPEP_0197584626 /NCGR_PEP_ID=MMETSP1326-20131121/7181_1 /TAXON_ID=1155430 /ORGANISM="Genus nov. species nov., Strain RCC2288" /LENGTH=107 /DNA_ID=CAMNT_0043149025 /DNA_START=80 /DNA_END=403 /DNA_ORIENTATION=+
MAAFLMGSPVLAAKVAAVRPVRRNTAVKATASNEVVNRRSAVAGVLAALFASTAAGPAFAATKQRRVPVPFVPEEKPVPVKAPVAAAVAYAPARVATSPKKARAAAQ